MCGRFAQAVPLGKLKKIDLFGNFNEPISESYNVTPGETAGIIIYRNKPELIISKWGFTTSYIRKGSAPKIIINARSESVAEKFTFKKAFQQARCVIPVSGFYEWKLVESIKEPIFIYELSPESVDSSLLFLAGLYQVADDDQLLFTVVTRQSEGILKEVHDRMPVCIPQVKLKNWLTPQTAPEELFRIMNTDYIKEFGYHPVSRAVNNPSNKTKECTIQTL